MRKPAHKRVGEVENPGGKKCFRAEPRRSDDRWMETPAGAPGQRSSLSGAGKAELPSIQAQELTYLMFFSFKVTARS